MEPMIIKRGVSQSRRAASKSKKMIKIEHPQLSSTDSNLFEKYYQMQLSLSSEETDDLCRCLRSRIPLLIRVNSAIPNYQMFCRKLLDLEKAIYDQQSSVDKMMKGMSNKESPQKLEITELKISPKQTAFQISASEMDLKRVEKFNDLGRFLQKCTQNRLISKQDLSSIFIPLLLEIQQTDMVLDICAAPGYKTCQILETMINKDKIMKAGCVIANDAEARRVQMLTQKVHDSGTINMLAVNHSGQYLPQFFNIQNGFKKKVKYNKILCDVPSSGDGLIRSIPLKWSNWKAKDAIQLHSLQLALLMKSVSMAEINGLIVYSTSSLNPIQNEAVITALFAKIQSGLQIIDIHGKYGLKSRRGLQNWTVCTQSKIKPVINNNPFQKKQKIDIDNNQKPLHQVIGQFSLEDQELQFEVLKSYEQVRVKHLSEIQQSMFPPEKSIMQKIQIRNCMRVLPIDNNSNGFFVALLRKSQDFHWKFQETAQKGYQIMIDSEDQIQSKFFKENMPFYQQQIAKEAFDQRNSLIQEYSDSQTERIQSIMTDYGSKRKGKFKGNKYGKLTQGQSESIMKFYGLKNELKNYLYVRQSSGLKKKVFLISQGIKKFIDADINKDLRLVKMGCKVLERGKESFAGTECAYRLCQDGIHFMINLMEKRKIKVPLKFFKMVLSIHSVLHHDIQDENIKNEFKQLGQGSFVLYIDEQIGGDRVLDGMVGQSFKNSFHLMISKEDVASLNTRYL